MATERAWGREPGWLATLPVDEQERLLADYLEAHTEGA